MNSNSLVYYVTIIILISITSILHCPEFVDFIVINIALLLSLFPIILPKIDNYKIYIPTKYFPGLF